MPLRRARRGNRRTLRSVPTTLFPRGTADRASHRAQTISSPAEAAVIKRDLINPFYFSHRNPRFAAFAPPTAAEPPPPGVSMTNQNQAFLYAGLTVLMWSTIATALKLALAALPPIPLILVAMGTALLVLGFLLMRRGRKPGGWADLAGLTRGERLNILAQGGILFCYYNLLLRAFGGLPAQVAQPINSTWALVLALLSAWALRQRLSPREFLWMLFAYGGVVIVATGGSSGELGPIRPLSLACVLGSTLLNAVYWLINAKNKAAPLLTLFLSFSVSFLLALLVLCLGGFRALPPPGVLPWSGISAAVVVGLFEMGIPFVLWSQALKLSSSVARVSTLSFLVPFLSLFWVSLILREPIALSTLAGLACIVSGTFLQQRAANRRLARQSREESVVPGTAESPIRNPE